MIMIYKKAYEKSAKHFTLSTLIEEMMQYQVCKGSINVSSINRKILQFIEKYMNSKQFDLQSNTWKNVKERFTDINHI